MRTCQKNQEQQPKMLQQVLLSWTCNTHSHTTTAPLFFFFSSSGIKPFLGRRQLFFDGISNVCSHSPPQLSTSSTDDDDVVVSLDLPPSQRKRLDFGGDFGQVVRKIVPSTTRRMLFASLFCVTLQAHALGDPSVTLDQVTPTVFPSGALFPNEERLAELFENNTYSVVNIFDVTLRPQLNITGVVEVPEGNGSGVVWDEQGHIVTNYHVIGNALSRNVKPGQTVARVNILASEGLQKNFEGKLIGADRAKDLAVLKVDAPKDLLKPINVGQSNSLRVGQQCLAIGNPFGFDHTLTVGVISGLNRDIFSQTGVTIGGGIQTDAAINPGNSGGPLLDSKGKLIGINTAIFTQTGNQAPQIMSILSRYGVLGSLTEGTSAGVGFAIPSTTVTKIVPQLINFGKVVRAGINIDFAPDAFANQLNVQNGGLILQVPGNSLAAKAGLLPTTRGFAGNIVLGDIIVAVDNKPVKSKSELDRVLEEYNVGDKVVLKVLRGSENVEIPIMLEEKSS